MFQSYLPKKYWVVACSINRLPSKTLKFSSSFPLLYDKKLNINYFRVIGSYCFPLPKTRGTISSLHPPTIVFYSTPLDIRHKCFRLNDSTIIVSRHMHFYEDVFPFKDYKTKIYSVKSIKELILHPWKHIDTSQFISNSSSLVFIMSQNQDIPSSSGPLSSQHQEVPSSSESQTQEHPLTSENQCSPTNQEISMSFENN